jgi:hypothetical protein
MGYESHNSIESLGSNFFFGIGYLVFAILKFKKCGYVPDSLYLFFIEAALELYLSCFLNLVKVEFQTFGDCLSIFVALLFLMIVLAMVPFVLIKYIIIPNEVNSIQFQLIMEGMKCESRYDKSNHIIYLVHRLLFAIIMVYLTKL